MDRYSETAGELSFANPSYDRITGEAIWSILSFGSYPQTEVKKSSLVSGITEAEYDENGDAWADGVRYRRLCKDDTEFDGYFGNEKFRYFKWEKINWRVLWNDGKTLFVMPDKGIDCKAYNDTIISVTWENCTMRKWLNNDFYNMAFSSKEQEAIVISQVQNGPVPKYMSGNGNDTEDKLYLLSIPELREPAYGFWEEKMYWGHKRDKKLNRRLKPSDYAHARGAAKCKHKDTGALISKQSIGNCSWWLRSRCSNTNYGAEVNEWGGVFSVGYYTRIFENAVVPVMHLELEKLLHIL